MGTPADDRRRRQRELRRLMLAEIKAEKAAQGWIRRHERVPTRGDMLVIGGAGWLLLGYNIEPRGLRLAREGRTVLLPLEQFLAAMEYHDGDAMWVEKVGVVPAPG